MNSNRYNPKRTIKFPPRPLPGPAARISADYHTSMQARLKRIETRICRLAEALGVDVK